MLKEIEETHKQVMQRLIERKNKLYSHKHKFYFVQDQNVTEDNINKTYRMEKCNCGRVISFRIDKNLKRKYNKKKKKV